MNIGDEILRDPGSNWQNFTVEKHQGRCNIFYCCQLCLKRFSRPRAQLYLNYFAYSTHGLTKHSTLHIFHTRFVIFCLCAVWNILKIYSTYRMFDTEANPFNCLNVEKVQNPISRHVASHAHGILCRLFGSNSDPLYSLRHFLVRKFCFGTEQSQFDPLSHQKSHFSIVDDT